MSEVTIKNETDSLEMMGVVGSPSSTNDLNLDILGTATEKKLIGNLGLIRYPQEGKDHYALGQITEISMQNTWVQDSTIKSLIRQKGVVSPITANQDTHRAKMIVSSVFSEDGSGKIEPSVFGTVPSTGTSIRLINNSILKKLLSIYQDEIFYLGNIYGNKDILLPTWFKQFEGETNEAPHMGIFGKTGSGKSVIAKMIALGYSKHKNMSIFILDPQGEFSDEINDRNSTLKKCLEKFDRKSVVVDLHNLVLSGADLFKKILIESGFFKELAIKRLDNQKTAADVVIATLEGKNKRTPEKNKTKKNKSLDQYNEEKETEEISNRDPEHKGIKLWHAHKKESFHKIWEALKDESNLNKIYSSKKGDRDRIANTMENEGSEKFYLIWEKVANLFSYENKKGGKIIKDWVNKLFNDEDKPIVSINLSAENREEIFWNDNVKSVVIESVLSSLTEKSEEKYKEKENLINTLVIIDEAHRLAPREKDDESREPVKKILIDAVRTTRKYGLGWMFISQTISSLDKEIINQMRIYLFGFGLGWGTELRALEELIGGNKEAINLYQSFKDPQSGIGKKDYPFMCVGPISPLSFSSNPLFLNALDYNNDEFKIANDLI